MRVELDAVSKGTGGHALPATTLAYETGRATLARAETEQRPSVLGLIATGRMLPDSGTVRLDGRRDYGALRRRVALIDAPEVCEPAPDVTVAGVTAEELMFAGRRSNPIAVRSTLDSLGLAEYAHRAMATTPPAARVRLLIELALLRRGVDGIVLTSPDRHGGDPNTWWRIAREIAAREIAVLVIAGDASAAAIGASGLIERISADHAAPPAGFPPTDDTDDESTSTSPA